MIHTNIFELVNYGVDNGLIDSDDRVYVTNRILEVLHLKEYEESQSSTMENRRLNDILTDISDYACKNGLIEEDTIAQRDLFDTKIMGCITPAPSIVRKKFRELYKAAPNKATEFYYKFSQDTNYIRRDRIIKDEKWTVDSAYGKMDITINLSKPEKDPKDIARAGKAKKAGYPKCLLCMENEGYSGNTLHPARQNHRVIPIQLDQEDYYLQYSPYVYYNEHCIVFNREHIPMRVDASTFKKLFDFVKQFPEYFLGSNADLPIVGGSILSHDHFQGGHYEFAMERAKLLKEFTIQGYEDIKAGILHWPLSVIRLRGTDTDRISELADHILCKWREYTDEEAFIFANTNGESHNTITPIVRYKDGVYEIDLALRNNITTEKYPLGVYHPHNEYHHIKKENIGLIEVMGLAVLPARLHHEMKVLAKCLVEKGNIDDYPELKSHKEWAQDIVMNYGDINENNVDEILRKEIGKVFVKVLENAGVFKCDEHGLRNFEKFIGTL